VPTLGRMKHKPREAIRSPSIPAHLLFFVFYNIVYFVPLLLVFLWGYSGGGAADAISMDASTMMSVTMIYIVAIAAFFAGNIPYAILRKLKSGATRPSDDVGPAIKLSDKLLIVSVAAVYVVSKIALIPLGVYREYAFTTGEMSGGVWSFSMFCSEAMVLLGILVLFSKARHNVLMFAVIALLNCVNLLHGSRIFFIVTVMGGILYAYLRGYLPWRRILIYGPLAACLMLGLTYFIFLSRTGLSTEGAFSAAKVVSPIVYESLFSQLSLVNLLRRPELWTATGQSLNFFSDIVLNTTPRILLAEKDALLYFSRFDEISPLGAMSGYASGLIYFGYFFPVFYFLIGFVGGWLHARAKTSAWWFIVYVYFTADFLFRIMRDGYLIPIKMLINAFEIIAILIAMRVLFKLARTRVPIAPSVEPR
jgi:hypothetical protein